MQPAIKELLTHLQAFYIPRLFVEGLGWDHYFAEPPVVHVDESDYTLKPIAEKASRRLRSLNVPREADGEIPKYSVRRKIETQVHHLGQNQDPLPSS